MLDKDTFGYLSLFFTLLSNAPYIYSILIGKTKPHIFSQLLWGLMTAIAAAGQYAAHAGPGAWAGILGASFSFVTVFLSWKHGEKTITRSDKICFALGLGAIPLWYVTADPLPAVILATLIDVTGYIPTFRKSYHKPHEEMIFSYAMSNAKHVMILFAISSYSLTTVLFPAALFTMNVALILMLVWLRKKPQALPL